MWDLGSVLILGSVVFIAIILIIGSIMEMSGKILLVDQKRDPVVKRRYGMGIMIFGALLFIVSLVLRSKFTSGQVAPFVWSGYAIWIIGGIIAVIRNELLKILAPKE